MKTVNIYRGKPTDEGTFGIVAFKEKRWYSLELPDKNNQKNISCIPQGEYICKIRYSPHFKRNTYHLQNVKDRTYILIHSANLAGDKDKGYQSHLNGCIALGKSRGSMKNKHGNPQRAIFTSAVAVREFMEAMNNEDFKLIIGEL